jgi:hypothetical protein
MKYKNLIGLTPSKEMVSVKSKLHRHFYSHRLDSNQVEYFFPNGYIKVMYLDNNNLKQLREETWEEIDKNTLRVRTMTFIKNGVREGEQISVIWD